MYSSDNPRLPQPLPRFLPPDADRRLTEALHASPNRLAADALLLQRACGLRIGELLDLELDAVIDIPGSGSWLKVPLGKLDTERMVPIDPEILALHRPDHHHPQPRTADPHTRAPDGPPTSSSPPTAAASDRTACARELDRAATTAGLGHVTPHQLRHTYATALVNAGVSLQALMAILGHVSAEMSLRYGRLFDTTIRAEYERALDLAKTRIGALPQRRNTEHRRPHDLTGAPPRPSRPPWPAATASAPPPKDPAATPTSANTAPASTPDPDDIPVLTRQRDTAAALAADATTRGWDAETERHLRLITRLNTLIDHAATRPPCNAPSRTALHNRFRR